MLPLMNLTQTLKAGDRFEMALNLEFARSQPRPG
jgi:hypothetical protein